MTKNYPKKVSKVPQNPRRPTDNYEIIRHFDPLERNTSRRTDLQAEIPRINANIDNEAKPNQTHTPNKPLKVFTPVRRRQTVITIPNVYLANTPTQSFVQGRNNNDYKNLPNPKFRSSSSSSVEVGFEKFSNKAKVRSKSFHSEQTKKSNENKKVVKSSIETILSPRLKSGNLRSSTDPVLLRKELNLKSLKQEILDNKRSTELEPRKPTSYSNSYLANSPRVLKLKDEINKTKNNDMLHKKIFITELKTEIAEYKRFNSYQVYTHTGSNPNQEASQNSLIPKSPKRISLREDSFETASKSGNSTPRDFNSFVVINPERPSGSSNVRTRSPQRSSLGESSKRKKSKDNSSGGEIKNLNIVRGSRNSSPNISKGYCGATANYAQGSSNRRSSTPTALAKSPQRSSLGEESKGKRKSKNSSDYTSTWKKCDVSKHGSSRRGSTSGERSLTGTDKESLLGASDNK